MRRGNIDISFIVIVVLLAASSLREGAFTDPMQWVMDKVMILPAIFIGITFHEFAHAVVAYKLGDQTPKLQGRVTLNPLAHIDLVGILCLFFVGFGWGKPVQIDPWQFKHQRRDDFLVSIAGVVMNFLLAIAFAIILKIALTIGGGFFYTDFGSSVQLMLDYVIYINLILMIFNLIPVPPLDGFNIIAQIFNIGQTDLYWKLYNYGNWILVALIVFGITGMIISPCVQILYRLIGTVVGLPLY